MNGFLAGGPTAIDHQVDTGNETTFVAGKEKGCVGDILAST
jgi:hypothetical protein